MAKKDTATYELEQEQGAPNPATDDSTPTPPAETQHEVNASGFYVYIGPNIRGLIRNGTIYRGTRAQAYAEAAAAIEKYKLVKTLIVSGDALPVARLKLKTAGNAFNINFRKLQGQLAEDYAEANKNKEV